MAAGFGLIMSAGMFGAGLTMGPEFRFSPLNAAHVGPAFPLLCTVAPRMTMPEWRMLCGHFSGGSSRGYVLKRDAYVRGLCLAYVEHSPAYGAILRVPVFVVASLFEQAQAAGFMIRSLLDVCQSDGLALLRIETAAEDRQTCDLLHRLDPARVDQHVAFSFPAASHADAAGR
jgi:hypothetical protein